MNQMTPYLLALLLAAHPLVAGAAPPARKQGLRLAVMPFENSNKAAADADLQALATGIPESMIQGLRNISTLQIVERDNMKHVLKEQAFAQTGLVDAKTAPKIGAILGANMLMVGSYQVVGDQLRINARFIKADTGEVLGDKSFTVTGKWKDGAFQTMDELAQKFVASFNVQVSQEQKQAVTQSIASTQNYDAYTRYLKGREYFMNFNHASFNRAIAEYQQAITVDPKYALAHAGLAYTYYYLGFLEKEVGNQYLHHWKKAEEHARRAVDLAPDTLLGHVALARVYLDTQRVGDAQREVEAAVRLNPNDPAVRMAVFALHVQQRLRDGGELTSMEPQAWINRLGPELAELQSVVADNPKDPFTFLFSGYVYSQLAMEKQAQADLQRALQLNPNLGTAARLALTKLYINRASALGGAINNKKAMDYVNKAAKEAELYARLDQGFNNPMVDIVRASKLVLQKKPAQAIQALQRVLAENPKNKDALTVAVYAFAAQKNPQALMQAVMALVGVLKEEVDSGQKESAGMLGSLLLDFGYANEAIPYLQAFYEYLPNAPTKQQIQRAQMGGQQVPGMNVPADDDDF